MNDELKTISEYDVADYIHSLIDTLMAWQEYYAYSSQIQKAELLDYIIDILQEDYEIFNKRKNLNDSN